MKNLCQKYLGFLKIEFEDLEKDIKKMKECKINAVLLGEALVTASDIPAKIKELMG